MVVGRACSEKRAGRMIPRLFIALVVASLAIPSIAAVAASTPASVLPGTGEVGGHGYPYWEAAWWRWRRSLPGITADKSACLTARQSGPVWFLSLSLDTRGNTFTCRVPGGRYLMLIGPGVECSTIESAPFHATTDPGLRTCTRQFWRKHQGGESLTVDGTAVNPPGWIIPSNVFAFTMPAQNNDLQLPGRTSGRAAYFGAASLLRPLTAGGHTLVWGESYTHPTKVYRVVFQLTVG